MILLRSVQWSTYLTPDEQNDLAEFAKRYGNADDGFLKMFVGKCAR